MSNFQHLFCLSQSAPHALHHLLKCPWPKSVLIVQAHLLSVEISVYPLDNSLRKITSLQLRSEEITPPLGMHLSVFLSICLPMNLSPRTIPTYHLRPCLWRQLNLLSDSKKSTFAHYLSASKLSVLKSGVAAPKSRPSCIPRVHRNLLLAWHSTLCRHKSSQNSGLEQKHFLMMLCALESNFWNPNYVNKVFV